MELKHAIETRRSVRSFKNKQVEEEKLDEIINAALCAPSAGNLQSRKFYVIRDEKTKKLIAEAAYGQQFIADAPVVFVVCADHSIKRAYGERGVSLYCIMDCAASVQNMLLTAHSLGLGGVWVGAFDEKEAIRILNPPEHLRPVAIVPLGYPAQIPKPHARVSRKQACIEI